MFASHASFAFAGARNDAQLHEAISTRQGIGEALGVLVHRHELDRHQAFEVLKKTAQKRDIKLRDIAAEVGNPPGASVGGVLGRGRCRRTIRRAYPGSTSLDMWAP